MKRVQCSGQRSADVAAVLDRVEGQFIGLVQGQPRHSAEIIPQLLRELQAGADVAVASRYVAGGGVTGWSTGQRVCSRGLAMLARLLLSSVRKVKDPLSGLFLARKEVLQHAELRSFGCGTLLGALASRSDWSVREVPHVEERFGAKHGHALRDQWGCLQYVLILAARDREIRRFVQFSLVGLTGVGVNFGTFWLLTRPIGLPDLPALALSWATSVLSNFALNDIWTFRDRRITRPKATVVRGLKFSLASAGAIGIYYAIYTPLTRFLGVYDLLAYGIAILAGLVWNFSINLVWTWRKRPAQPPSGS